MMSTLSVWSMRKDLTVWRKRCVSILIWNLLGDLFSLWRSSYTEPQSFTWLINGIRYFGSRFGTNSGDNNEKYEAFSTIPDQFNQEELNDLIRNLNLSKESSELLAWRIKEKNCLSSEARITFYRTRERHLLPYYLKCVLFGKGCKGIAELIMDIDLMHLISGHNHEVGTMVHTARRHSHLIFMQDNTKNSSGNLRELLKKKKGYGHGR